LADPVAAVRLRGAQIVGRLNLGGQTLSCPLELTQCHLAHRLDLATAEAPSLSLRGSYLRVSRSLHKCSSSAADREKVQRKLRPYNCVM
jgi:hypothetical protein